MNLTCAYLGYTYRSGRSPQLAAIATILLLLSIPTTIINAAIFSAIFRKKELKTPTYFIIANLAITDFLSGCTAYLFYATVCIMFALGNNACPVAAIGTPLSYLLGCTTYNTIAWQSIERYLAVFYPFWYHEKFTPKVALMGNLSTWLASCGLMVMLVVTKDNKLFNGILGPVSSVFLCLIIFAYIRIFKEVKRVQRDMVDQQVLSRAERRKILSDSKVAKATTIILVSVSVCYTPLLVHEFFIAFHGWTSEFLNDTLYWEWFLALINSSISPLIACRQLKLLRTAVMRQFRVFRRKVEPVTSQGTQQTKTSQSCFELRDVSNRNGMTRKERRVIHISTNS